MYYKIILINFSWILILSVINVDGAVKYRAPVFDLDQDVSYVGSVSENAAEGTVIEVNPAIRVKADTGPICTYRLTVQSTSADQPGDQPAHPFEVVVVDQPTGQANVLVKESARVDCETQPEYRLTLVAVRCPAPDGGEDDMGAQSDSVSLVIKIDDENEYEPSFPESWYEISVDEGRLYDRLFKLEAEDRDCSRKFSEICRYEITNGASQFTIDTNGVIRNSRPLSHAESPSHLLTVRASDCGMHQGKETVLKINVRRQCSLGFTNITERETDYPAGSGVMTMWPMVSVDLCNVVCPETESVNASIRLHSEHIGRGCDRDADTLATQRKECGANPKTVSLLEHKMNVIIADGNVTEGTGKDATDDEEDETYYFDGKNNAILVDEAKVAASMPDKFSFTFWMKHDPHSHAHAKENILCSSDDHRLNRHHFAIFIRNCKLEMLFRREFDTSGQNTFKPAEWRWSIPGICDGEWHQYSVGVQFPQVQVYADGRLFEDNEENLEILDDWPMHATKDLKTKLVIGACWHGRTEKMAQFFNGYLAGLTFLAGEQESGQVVQCMHMCRESLDFQKGLENLKPGMEAVFNHEMTELNLRAKDVTELESMIQRVAYVNTRKEPTPGHRTVAMNASVKCKDVDTVVSVPAVKSLVMVTKAKPAELVISGAASIPASISDVTRGVNIFPNLRIQVVRDGVADKAGGKLDWCQISTTPTISKEFEYFSSPADLIVEYELDFEHVEKGLLIKGHNGPEDLEGFQKIINQLHYFNLKAQDSLSHVFTFQCSMQSEKVLSNKLDISLNIGESKPTPAAAKKLIAVKESSEFMDGEPSSPLFADKLIATVMKDLQESAGSPESIDANGEEIAPAVESKAGILVQEDPVVPPAMISVNKQSFGPVPLISAVAEENIGSVVNNTGASSAVAVVVVVCVGFLLLLVVVGVLKMRAGQRPRKDAHGDLAWDDSGLNITVNPLEDAESGAVRGHPADSDDSSDECDSYRDDEEYDDDDDSDEGEDCDPDLPHVAGPTGGTLRRNGLEWEDDLSLHQQGGSLPPSHPAASPNNYRV